MPKGTKSLGNGGPDWKKQELTPIGPIISSAQTLKWTTRVATRGSLVMRWDTRKLQSSWCSRSLLWSTITYLLVSMFLCRGTWVSKQRGEQVGRRKADKKKRRGSTCWLSLTEQVTDTDSCRWTCCWFGGSLHQNVAWCSLVRTCQPIQFTGITKN